MEQVDIKGFEDYQITDDGRVWSKKSKKWMKQHIRDSKKGYLCVGLCINGKRIFLQIHKIVAKTFIPNPQNKPCIDHINTIRTDNRVENLRWVTYEENSNNPITLQRCSDIRKGKKLSETTKKKLSEAHIGQISARRKKVYQYTKDKQLINEYESVTDAAKKNNFDRGSIGHCCRGKLKTYKGYIWKYN